MDKDIRLAKKILRKSGYRVVRPLKESVDYEDYTSEQFEEELNKIEYRIDDIQEEMRDIPYSDRGDLYYELEEIEMKLISMEDYIPEEMLQRVSKLYKEAMRVEDTEYEGSPVRYDPYADAGMKPSDFY